MTNDDDPRDWDAAYLLGALSPADRQRYEAWLRENPGERAELAELAGLPAILRSVPADEAVALLSDEGLQDGADVAPLAAVPGATVQALAGRIRARRRRRTLGVALVAAASAVLLVIGGFAVGALHPSGPVATPQAALLAMTPATGSPVRADVGLTAKKWGTRIDWNCSYGREWSSDSGSYDLVVTAADGTRTTVATWSAVGDQASDLTAATAIPASSIRSIAITASGSATPLASRSY